jgi:hypothetical protein
MADGRDAGSAGPGGDWPHTKRLLPWLIAAFIVMIWLVPFDAIELDVPLPVDPKLDRILLAGLALIWLLSVFSSRPERPLLQRPTGVDVAVLAFVLIALTSVLLNVERISLDGELELATKKFVLLVSLVLFYLIVTTTIRAAELHNYSILIVALATLTALGIIVEYRFRTNLFFDWTDRLLPSKFEFSAENTDPRWGRRSITGPTSHGLAATAILAMALPFALVGMMESKERREKLLYALATALILTAAMSTLRKSAAFAPAAALLVMLAYRPRALMRLLPLGLLIIVFIQAAAPGALGSIRKQLEPGRFNSTGTTQDRVADYDATKPDRVRHLALGRGYGTYDHNKYRLLDNQYLNMQIGVGYIGFAAYLALWMSIMGVADYAIRGPTRRWAGPALAASAAALVFGVVSALFDVMAFPHVPYLLLLCAGMAVVASRAAQPQRAPATTPQPGTATAAALKPVLLRPSEPRRSMGA